MGVPVDFKQDEEFPRIDNRSAAVIWAEGEDFPEIVLSGTSVYEAIGFFFTAALDLALHEIEDKDEDDDYDEDDF